MTDHLPFRYELYRGLHRLLAVGSPLSEALETLASDAPRRWPARLIRLATETQKGRSLSSAMGEEPHAFPMEERTLLAFAESRGLLSAALAEAARSLEARRIILNRQKNLASAFLILMALMIAYSTFLFGNIIPVFMEEIFLYGYSNPYMLWRIFATLHHLTVPLLLFSGALGLLMLLLQLNPGWLRSIILWLTSRTPILRQAHLENDFARLCMLVQMDLSGDKSNRVNFSFDPVLFSTPKIRHWLHKWHNRCSDALSPGSIILNDAHGTGPVQLFGTAFSARDSKALCVSLATLNHSYDQRARPGNISLKTPLTVGLLIHIFFLVIGFIIRQSLWHSGGSF